MPRPMPLYEDRAWLRQRRRVLERVVDGRSRRVPICETVPVQLQPDAELLPQRPGESLALLAPFFTSQSRRAHALPHAGSRSARSTPRPRRWWRRDKHGDAWRHRRPEQLGPGRSRRRRACSVAWSRATPRRCGSTHKVAPQSRARVGCAGWPRNRDDGAAVAAICGRLPEVSAPIGRRREVLRHLGSPVGYPVIRTVSPALVKSPYACLLPSWNTFALHNRASSRSPKRSQASRFSAA